MAARIPTSNEKGKLVSMQSHYAINVAKVLSTDQFGSRYMHMFQTAPNSIVTKRKADEVLTLMRAKFPENEGYRVRMTYWECVGHECG